MDPDRGGPVVADAAGFAGFLDAVVVVPGTFDGSGTGTLASFGDQQGGEVGQVLG
jgi:hypothetical protein